MNEILDEDYSNPNKKVVDKKRKYIQNRTIIYLTVMIGGGLLCVFGYLKNSTIQDLLGNSSAIRNLLFNALNLMMLSFVIELIYQLFKLLLIKNKTVTEKQYPFWFRWLEGSFTIWIFLVVIMVVGTYLRS